MKRSATILGIATLALVLTVQSAEARNPFTKKRARPDTASERVHRYNHFPTMEFAKGTLNRGSRNGWELDGLALKPVRDCHVEVDGSSAPGIFESGRQALVMGHRQNGEFVVYRVRILQPAYAREEADLTGLDFQRSDADPSVGTCLGPN